MIDNRIHQVVNQFLSNAICLIIMLIVVRLISFAYITPVFLFPKGSWKYQLIGLGYDILFWLKFTSILFFPFIGLYIIRPIIARWFIIVMSVLIVMINIGLDFYFGTTKIPLGADVFGYSWDEITSTIGSSGNVTPGKLMLILIVGFVTSVLFYRIQIFINETLVFYIYDKLLIVIFCIGGFGVATSSYFKDTFSALVASNKAGYFLESVQETYLLGDVGGNYVEMPASSSMDNLQKHHFVDPSFPFFHKDTFENVLGNYFKKEQVKPNIVYLVVEGLGRAYSGKGAYLGSFTPFLDSLTNTGLYWENVLSTTGRTFGVLPTLMGSLPFGEHGFADMKSQMPNHRTLITMLQSNGYESAFYYGGHAHFDDMETFLKRQKINHIYDEASFSKTAVKMPSSADGETWGYGDKELFNNYINKIKNTNKPRLDVMLTLSTHDPFLINEQEKYLAKFRKYQQKLKLTKEEKEYNVAYEKSFASLLYFDDALKNLIENYSKRPDFKNTIFIITGDHRMPEIPIASQLDRFHVPLLIWSPLLTQSARFKSISTHFDVLPSVIALLQGNYKCNFPIGSSIIGTGLDTEKSFRNLHSYPLMRNKSEFMDYLHGEYFLSGKELYRISPTMDITPLNDGQQKAILENQFGLFKQKNKKAMSKKSLLKISR